MQDSYTSIAEAQRNGMTDVYRFWFGVPVAAAMPDLQGMTSAGALAASAEDMARYVSMYLNGGSYQGVRLLSAEGIAQMLRPATNEFSRRLLGTEFTAQYGMGWFIGKFGEASAMWHLGELPWMNAWMVLLPETQQAVVVLINAGTQFDLAGATQVMSRIPIGAVNLLTGHPAPAGMSLTRVYVIFDLIVVAVVALQVLALARLLLRPVPRERLALARYTTPLVWEFGLSLLMLIGYPMLTGVGWRANFTSTPDLVLVLVIVASLWLATGLVRAGRLAATVLERRRAPRASARPRLQATRAE
jgi:hypothetical protein